MTGPPVPDPLGLLVALTRLEVKVDNLTNVTTDHGRDIKELKDRRWPTGPATLLLSAAGTGMAIWALLRGH